jgi:RNA polymerase sigma-70 factor (ECF subfamily)
VLANQRRGARRHAGLADRLADELATQLPALTGADTADVGLREALTRVPERDREVLLLSAWEDLTPAQIAAVTGLRRATVRTRLHRARRRLRAELELDQAKPSPIYDLAKEQTS